MAFKQVLFICALIQLSTAAVEVPGKLLVNPSVEVFSPFAAAEPPTCDGVSVYSTCSDCDNVLVCMGAASDSKSCATTSPSTPFCVDGKCAATPNTAAGCFPPSITCSGVGFYPDPKNCQIYHYCEENSKPSSVYECPPNYVYNADTKLCKQKIYPKDCVTVTCDKTKIFVNYGTSKVYFAFCQYENDAVKTIQILKCADNTNFDGTGCVFKCPGVGNYAHMDPAKYYQCYNSGVQLIYIIQSCPTDKKFDQKLGVCVTSAPSPAPGPAPAPSS